MKEQASILTPNNDLIGVKKPFARKIQILTVMEQRAKVMGKSQVASIAKKGKDAIRKRNKSTA